MRCSLRWLSTPSCLAIAIAGMIQARGAEPAGPVDVVFSLQQATVTLHEPVFVNFLARRNTLEPVTFDLGFDAKEGFRFSVAAPSGPRVRLPQYSRGGLGVGGKRTLGPGEVYTQTILFSEFYAPDRTGSYGITAQLGVPVETASGRALGGQAPAALILNVAGRDPRRLAAVCGRLVEQATMQGDIQVAKAAALALRYVVDPVAVPYLGRVLTGGDPGGIAQLAATGLARIGTPDAVEFLRSALRSTNNQGLRASIESALWEVKTGGKVEVKD